MFFGEATTFHAGEGRLPGIRRVMGERSVVTTDEAAHQRLRKLLMPPFHGAALRGYRDMMSELAAEEVRQWPVDTPFRGEPRMNAVTLEMILRVVLGVSEGPRFEEIRRTFSGLVSAPAVVYLAELVTPLQGFGPWKRFGELLARIDELLSAGSGSAVVPRTPPRAATCYLARSPPRSMRTGSPMPSRATRWSPCRWPARDHRHHVGLDAT